MNGFFTMSEKPVRRCHKASSRPMKVLQKRTKLIYSITAFHRSFYCVEKHTKRHFSNSKKLETPFKPTFKPYLSKEN